MDLTAIKPRFVPRRAALGGDDLDVVGVDLRHHHRDIGGKPVGAVVGDHRTLGLGVGFLQRLDLILFHVHGAENKIHPAGNFLHNGWRPAPPCLLHFPAWGWASASGRPPPPGTVCRQTVPRAARAVSSNQGCSASRVMKTLPHHAGGAHNADFVFFHFGYRPFCAGAARQTCIHHVVCGIRCFRDRKNGPQTRFGLFAGGAKKPPDNKKTGLKTGTQCNIIEYCISAQRNMPYRHDSPAPFRPRAQVRCVPCIAFGGLPFSPQATALADVSSPTDTHENRASVLGYIIALHGEIVNEKRGRNQC